VTSLAAGLQDWLYVAMKGQSKVCGEQYRSWNDQHLLSAPDKLHDLQLRPGFNGGRGPSRFPDDPAIQFYRYTVRLDAEMAEQLDYTQPARHVSRNSVHDNCDLICFGV
jgi:hypothetical protein